MFILLAYVSQVIYHINTLTSDNMFIKDRNIFTLYIFITSTSDKTNLKLGTVWSKKFETGYGMVRKKIKTGYGMVKKKIETGYGMDNTGYGMDMTGYGMD